MRTSLLWQQASSRPCLFALQPTLDYSCDFHASPVTDALLVQSSSQCFLASCSQDGKVQLQQLQADDGQLVAPPATVDLRQQAQLRGVRLASLAACPMGSLLAAGALSKCWHFVVFKRQRVFFTSTPVFSCNMRL